MKRVSIYVLLSACLVFSSIAYLLLSKSNEQSTIAFASGENKPSKVTTKKSLPKIGSYEKLLSILKEAEKHRYEMYGRGIAETTAGAIAMEAEEQSTTATKDQAADYSGTNVQVQGVDEADVVKTDGEYIYQVNYDRVMVIKAYPANTMKIVEQLIFKDQNFAPREMYVDDQHLIVIGSTHHVSFEHEKNASKELYYPYLDNSYVKAYLYDISNKEAIKQVREIEIEGHYVSSRKINSSLYLVTNKYIDTYRILQEKQEASPPVYSDSNTKQGFQALDYDRIYYFPESVEPNYLLVAGLNLEQMDQELQVSAYLGSGQNIYASPENLYVSVTQYKPTDHSLMSKIKRVPVSYEYSSSIYKFKLIEGQVEFIGQGEVPGSILNQFSMDEHSGHFRIATTTGQMWRNDEFTSKNNLYILDQDLKVVGKIEDIAPGERIYSVRFMGDRGYMVTFKTVDPLFVFDLHNPSEPKILGELKIPGYSDYLHPYDEHHLIGFGMDTVELANNGNPIALTQGLKIALFDITDVHNPKEKFVEVIGDRGTYSELLHNHKALLFSKEKNLLAFPVTLMEIKNKATNPKEAMHQWGEFTFQGAYIYSIDLNKGFQLRKRVTHISQEEYKKSGSGWYNGDKNIERILYIGENLYTLSKGALQAHRLKDLSELANLDIPSRKQLQYRK